MFKNLSEHGLQSSQALKCGELLTLMLTRCWPKPQGSVPCSSKTILQQVLTWRLWPCFFQRFGNTFCIKVLFYTISLPFNCLLKAFLITEGVLSNHYTLFKFWCLGNLSFLSFTLLICEGVQRSDAVVFAVRECDLT